MDMSLLRPTLLRRSFARLFGRVLGTDDQALDGPPFLAPEPEDADHARALSAAHEHRWNWAQRDLEELIGRLGSGDEATAGRPAEDLASVRAVRRCLRALNKRPRDPKLRVELAKHYLELEMGGDAERELLQAATLAPEDPEPLYLLALEHYYRGEADQAERTYATARAIAPDLPPFAEVVRSLTEHLGAEEPRGGGAALAEAAG